MSTIGRIFSVLNVFLAAAFLGFAATHLASQQNFKKQLEDYRSDSETRVSGLEGQLSDARARLETTEADLLGKQNELASAVATIADRDSSIAAERGRADQNAATLEQLTQKVGGLESQIAAIQAARDQFEKDKVAAIEGRHAAEQEREAALAAQRTAEQQLGELQTRLGDLEKSVAAAQKQVQEKETQLAALQASTGTSLAEIMVQPDVRGAVLFVSYEFEPGLVTINRGSNDGLKRGMEVDVWNGKQLKGTVRLESVRETMATGIIIRSIEGTSIQQGDSAATRI